MSILQVASIIGNPSLAVNSGTFSIGSNVTVNATGIYVGNSSVNASINAAGLYINNSPVAVTFVRQAFTGNGACTIFTVTGGYTPNYLEVYRNGVPCVAGSITISSGTVVVFAEAPMNGEVIEVSGLTSAVTVTAGGVNSSLSYTWSNSQTFANTVSFANGTSSNVMVIAANGNIGIGNSLPSSTLTVNGNTNITGAIIANNSAGSNSYVLSSTGTGIFWALPNIAATVNVFSSNGTFTVPANVTRVKVIVVGAGGSGGMTSVQSGAGGGGAGGAAIKYISGLTPGATIPVTVGLGGNSLGTGAGVVAGYTGGNSSFGTYCTATGGNGGINYSTAAYGSAVGGIGSNGDVNILGQSGFGSVYMYGTYNGGGDGGNSIFGGGGRGVPAGGAINPNQNTSSPGQAPGAAGGGGSTNYASGAGANGIVIVEY